MSFIRYMLLGLAALLAGCSQSPQDNQQLALLAASRAQLLSAQLPLESGPISIMRATSDKNVVELMMIYNSDGENVPTTEQLVVNSVNTYCNNSQTRSNLNAGLLYRIKVRNTRGQLMIDRLVSRTDCK